MKRSRKRPRGSEKRYSSHVRKRAPAGEERRGGGDAGRHASAPDAPRLSDSAPFVAPNGWTYIPIPPSNTANHGQSDNAGPSQAAKPGQWHFIPADVNPTVPVNHSSDIHNAADISVSNASSIKTESMKWRIRRENKKQADKESLRRKAQGLQPHAVQVKPSEIVDSGCKGHLKWQEYVRNLTPKFLDMSIILYEEQSEHSRAKLWETTKNSFEFLDYEVTQKSFDRMIKTWLRKDRERMKRNHGSSVKAPPHFSDKEWESMRKYWNSPDTKQVSERMCETRKKVANNPRLGRLGYAGKRAEMVSQCWTILQSARY